MMAPSRALFKSSWAAFRALGPIAAAEAARSTTRLARRRAFSAAFSFATVADGIVSNPAGLQLSLVKRVMRCVGSFWRPARAHRHTSISGSARLGTALCTSVLANPAFALLSRIRLKAPAPSTTKVLSLEMKFELKSLVQSEVPRRSAPLTDSLEERPHMCPMWTTSGCLARREPHLDFSNATRGTSLGVGFRGL